MMRLSTGRRFGWRAVLAAAWVAAALRFVPPPPAALAADPGGTDTLLEYTVMDAKTMKLLHTVQGWTEAGEGGAATVIAVSKLIFPAGNQLEISVTFSRDEPPRCLSWKAVIRDRNGAVVGSAEEQVVADAYPFLTRPLPPNTYPPLAPLGYVLTRLGLGVRQRASFHFILMGSSMLQMDLWVDGREAVRVPAGEFDCHRVRMRVNPESVFPKLPGFLRPFVSFFIPTHTLWLSAQGQQTLVKYTGQMGPPGSPELLVQLMSASQRQAAR